MRIAEPHKNHRRRMRERFDANGLDGFKDHEILEMLLFYTLPRRNTNVIAHDLLNAFGGALGGVFSAEREELKTVSGIGPASVDFLALLSGVIAKVISETAASLPLNTKESAGVYAVLMMGTVPAGSALAVYLDENGVRLGQEWLYRGKDRITDGIRMQMIEKAGDMGARGLMIVHNHRHEPEAPSPDDFLMTDSFRDSVNAAGIKDFWHVIVTDDGYTFI